jgi:Domain of unknown function (DUF4949)
MFGRKLLSAVATFSLASTLYAAPLRHVECPSVDAIQSKGVSLAMEVMPNVFLGMEAGNYNTSTNWVFAIGLFETDSEEVALDAANDALAGIFGPVAEDDEDGMMCLYATNDPNVGAIAIEDDGSMPASKIKRKMLRFRK